ncbi:hypothetical protein TNIN_119781 [Trichonephila inaurata madagascariensis]|uniref:Uncharacterized protein n=1 Tax=Trichonephila inaurata madagascariensis TaxID=2747483 RepID=A0A8X6YF88_9ARAC|nr:hypothetical protein TNIN_119781 [Trichonephila inaurata madagascariensis]
MMGRGNSQEKWPTRSKWGDNTSILLYERREHNAMEMPAILLFGRHASARDAVSPEKHEFLFVVRRSFGKVCMPCFLLHISIALSWVSRKIFN